MKVHIRSEAFLSLGGRLLIAVLFLPDGFAKIPNFSGIVGLIASKGLPLPELFAAGTILLEIGASIALLVGWGTRWAAISLAVFTICAGVLFHNFWALQPAMAIAQKQAFFKNIAIAGGLLLLAAHGPGRLSVDARRRPVTAAISTNQGT